MMGVSHSRSGLVSRSVATWVYFLLVFASICSVLPLLWTVSSSFKSVGEIFQYPPTLLPKDPNLDNYRDLFNTVPGHAWLVNSAITVVIATVTATVVSSAAGYAFAKFQFAGSKLIYAAIVGSLAVPLAVLIEPLFGEVAAFNMVGNPIAMTFPYLAPPLGVIAMRQYAASSVPNELLEAARMDGAGEVRIFLRIAVPLLSPGMAVVAVWAFFSMYIAYLWPLVVAFSNDQLTLTAGVGALASGLAPKPGVAIAGAVFGALPTLLLLIILRRYFVQGLAVGAVKG